MFAKLLALTGESWSFGESPENYIWCEELDRIHQLGVLQFRDLDVPIALKCPFLKENHRRATELGSGCRYQLKVERNMLNKESKSTEIESYQELNSRGHSSTNEIPVTQLQ
ncbi:MAG: hypothetical protein KDA65_03610 [Planctomycetaceae bacterium]|nr:hypothetical protein [Planctomycetaceae bacterium]